MHVKNMETWEVCVGMRSISGPDTRRRSCPCSEKLSMLGEVVRAGESRILRIHSYFDFTMPLTDAEALAASL